MIKRKTPLGEDLVKGAQRGRNREEAKKLSRIVTRPNRMSSIILMKIGFLRLTIRHNRFVGKRAGSHGCSFANEIGVHQRVQRKRPG